MDGNFLIDPILHQGIHDGAVHLPEESARLAHVFREDDEAVVVEDVAVQFFSCAGFLAYTTGCALESYLIVSS